MIHTETLWMAFASLRAHPLRTFLTLLGVIIGVTTVVTVVSIISGLNGYIENKVLTLGADAFVVSKFGIITSREAFIEALKRRDITYDEMLTVRRLCTECAEVGADVTRSGAVRYEDERLPDTPIHGSTSNINEIQFLDLDDGRFFTESEVASSRPVAVIGADIKQELFGALGSIGRVIKLDGNPYKVIGVLQKKGSILGQNQDKVVYVPLTTWEKNFGARRSLEITVKAVSKQRLVAAQEQVRQILRARRHTAYAEPDPFNFVTASALDAIWRGISAGAFALVTAISTISLVVGGIVIMNIMLVSVAERTHEIGIRRALGARARTIQMQFLMEAVVLAAAGGVIGVLLGTGIARLVESVSPIPVQVRLPLVATSLGLATLVGVASGLFPSIQASKLMPTEALRNE
ncbi:MAG TPA: ABC transporter permease [Candidatus Polarisedimenticolia bacterium]|nr:ABC transporter permease [Candidatus Polarisedimenticolia bacterium]